MLTQFLNASKPTVVSESPETVREVMPSQPSNALLPIETPFSVTSPNAADAQPLNAFALTVTRFCGKSNVFGTLLTLRSQIYSMEEQPSNAESLMIVIRLGKYSLSLSREIRSTLFNAEADLNTHLPIELMTPSFNAACSVFSASVISDSGLSDSTTPFIGISIR